MSIENSPSKIKISEHNKPKTTIYRPVKDIYMLLDFLRLLDSNTIKRIKLFLCGFSCTSLSSQGKRELFDGESKIFFECLKCLKFIQSINPDVKFFFENVASMPNECKDLISRELEVDCFCFDSSTVSHQARVRYYWFNWAVTKKKIKPIKGSILNVLDKDALLFFAFSKSHRQDGTIEGRQRTDGKCGTLTTGPGCNGQSTKNIVITKSMKPRDLTVNECKRIQGLKKFDFSCVSDSVAFEAIGEGWQFDAAKEIISWANL